MTGFYRLHGANYAAKVIDDVISHSVQRPEHGVRLVVAHETPGLLLPLVLEPSLQRHGQNIKGRAADVVGRQLVLEGREQLRVGQHLNQREVLVALLLPGKAHQTEYPPNVGLCVLVGLFHRVGHLLYQLLWLAGLREAFDLSGIQRVLVLGRQLIQLVQVVVFDTLLLRRIW